MKRPVLLLAAVSAVYLGHAGASLACDLHSINSALDQRAPSAGSFHLGLAEEYSESRRIQNNGSFVPNEAHEGTSDSRTTLSAAYDFSDAWTLEATIPYINRRYRRLIEEESVTGSESGFGDTTLRVAAFAVRDYQPGQRRFVRISAGVKLPTGNTDPLAESHDQEGEEMLDDTAMRHGGEHHGEELLSGVHGHDIALGSGSFDFPIGAGFYVEQNNLSFDGQVEYTVRTEGDHSYRHANDLRWEFGPGISFGVAEGTTAVIKVNVSGAYKGKDKQSGERDNATSQLGWFVGPEVLITGQQITGYLGYDLPVNIENSGYQAVTDYKVRAGLVYKF